ncbi:MULTISPECIES: class I SAM-dependent methyltransferase [Paeniglutamicibacter]|uniref:Trans-aconitate methyltransferase n=1 Tax=Paeniglutamicibacter sulfureus TaxID=43666 RepID=A0ABU2BD68_9MICC|nr:MULTISPECIES: class I SAM-dependent methyltransferase [Paeniglutamicibacter]MCV9996502.1 class I SAM-dependent methyltransferase [Paeniglutamicibacter sp. ZC-3]MDR7356545.1 trans-aconitate methyltransferase [Paeniglutamicibacter sulfureus]
MTDSQVQQAYAARASEYTTILGAIDDMHEPDRNRIEHWAQQISGRIIDAGCGPGHWTDFLHKRGADISGIDLVPEFIESARLRFPDVPFQVSSLRALDEADGSLNGVLVWYSLIHLPPADLPPVLCELARVLSPQGHLLVGFFDGEAAEPFDHTVAPAYYWSVAQMCSLLHDAGFDVIDTETRQDPGGRPHAAISAIAR